MTAVKSTLICEETDRDIKEKMTLLEALRFSVIALSNIFSVRKFTYISSLQRGVKMLEPGHGT
jgi:hypothetical protein